MSNIPELHIPRNHCKSCPTVMAIGHGHDPESFQILTEEDYFRAMDADGFDNIYCPWKQGNCVVHPVEWRWARECHDRGIIPPIKLHPAYSEFWQTQSIPDVQT